jgi:hypothetical protein
MARKRSKKSKSRSRKKSRSQSRHGSMCPTGYIVRSSYDRKSHSRKGYKRASGVKVAPARISRTHVGRACTPHKGKSARLYSGKTPANKRVLPKPGNEVSLRKYGYKTRKSDVERHKSLKRASHDRGTLKILKRLSLLRNYNADPKAKRVMSRDVKYMSRLHSRKKGEALCRSRSKK